MTDGPVFRGPDGRTLSPEKMAKLLRGLAGEKLPGGCDDCVGAHSYVEDAELPGLFHIQIHHEETCPQRPPEADDEG